MEGAYDEPVGGDAAGEAPYDEPPAGGGGEEEEAAEGGAAEGGAPRKAGRAAGAAAGAAPGFAGFKCRVAGCAQPEDTSLLRRVNQRARACPEHLKALSLDDESGALLRFCQRCSKWEPVAAFEGVKRTCTAQLALHNERRRAAYATSKATSVASDKQAASAEATGADAPLQLPLLPQLPPPMSAAMMQQYLAMHGASLAAASGATPEMVTWHQQQAQFAAALQAHAGGGAGLVHSGAAQAQAEGAAEQPQQP